MVSGKFELPDESTSQQLVEGKYRLAPLYKVHCIAVTELYKVTAIMHYNVATELYKVAAMAIM